MIEIVLGLVIIAGLLAMLTGVGGMFPGSTAFDPLPLLGYGGVGVILVVGTLLLAAGFTRRAVARRGGAQRRDLQSARLKSVGCLATAALAIGIPLVAEPLNVVRVDGFPVGYYLAAQGALIGLVVLAFAWASRQNVIDAEESGDHE